MRKAAITAILIASLSIGLPYAFNGQWWGLVIALLAGSLWCYGLPPYQTRPAHHRKGNLSPTLSFLTLAGFGSVGVFFGYSEIWALTSFVLLLIAWDLEHYTQILQSFEDQEPNKNTVLELYYAHLKRLAILAGVGWGTGLVALTIRIQINLSFALLLIFVMIIGLRQVARYLVGRTS
jgi:hypothetical protein